MGLAWKELISERLRPSQYSERDGAPGDPGDHCDVPGRGRTIDASPQHLSTSLHSAVVPRM